MAAGRHETRQRILQAASELAWETGPGNLSLEAVANKAGVSKGGLLYHFPSKSKLLEATVESFVQNYNGMLEDREKERGSDAHPAAGAYLDLFLDDQRCKRPPSSGILAALAEDPSFLEPMRRNERALLDRLKVDLGDTDLALILYLTIAGLKSADLLSIRVVEADEVESVAEKLRTLIKAS